jgi:hypothetical protein
MTYLCFVLEEEEQMMKTSSKCPIIDVLILAHVSNDKSIDNYIMIPIQSV